LRINCAILSLKHSRKKVPGWIPDPTHFSVGIPGLQDIMEELKKSGRDPGKEFGAASFRDDVQEIADSRKGST
jgi:transcriptional accessory protein Tex/SPT6